MKHYYTLLLSLAGILTVSHSVAQNTVVIGKARSYIEVRYLPTTNYKFGHITPIDEDNLEGYVYTDNTTGIEDIKKTLVILYKDDVCTTSVTITAYENLKYVLGYLNDHYKKVGKEFWVTLDGKYIMVMSPNPKDNSVRVVTQVKE